MVEEKESTILLVLCYICMSYTVKFFESIRGEQSVEKFIKSLDDQTKAKFLHLYDLLHSYGPRLTFPHTKFISKNIFELRIRGKTEVRIFYTNLRGIYILLHAFKKKTQKIPIKELHIAQRRLTEI